MVLVHAQHAVQARRIVGKRRAHRGAELEGGQRDRTRCGHGLLLGEDFSSAPCRAATAALKVAESDTVSRMRTASRFVEALKKSVRARGLTYAELARRLRLSEASVKRMFSRGTFN